ncbi:C-GCAxxG-C-C family protein [Nitratidesulfovibrio sp.]|uniref:C-GCAxxG-C-C family protein n=1 Tax=Nitratidesulfovibrio sp. TaxID=2802297 RepID=UPI00333FDB57
METDAARDQAQAIFEAGFNCAEAVFLVVTQAFGLDAPDQVRLATAFGGGVGRCKEEMCGAVAGAVLAIGALCGRERPGADWDLAARLARMAREDALAAHGSIRCGELLHAFGEQTGMQHCIRFTTMVAGQVVAPLRQARDNGELVPPVAPGRAAGARLA